MPPKFTEIEVEGRRLKLTNLEKIMYPAAGFTKGRLIEYYASIAPALLPHLHDRPLTLKRYPEGVNGFHFYEKNCPAHRPDWVKTARIWSPGNNRWMQYCMVQDLPTLVWAGNLADVELHTSLSLARDILKPTVLAFDLDPGPPANIVQCCQVGLWLRGVFAELGMEAYPKTSGSKGLQVYVPLNTAVSYDETKPFAKAIARLFELHHPELVVSDMKKSLRVGKVLVDWSQNDDYKTTVCVYSLRAREQPTVSTPLKWEEVAGATKKADPELLVFDSQQALARVEKMGDLFEPVLARKQKLPSLEKLEAAVSMIMAQGGSGSRPLPPAPTPRRPAAPRQSSPRTSRGIGKPRKSGRK
ncbi:MAG: non-homologous end-joining DNA ligase [Acidobacteria bacterium]|nr:non-homologous end-joining DNA ligase [Acidobacteriota bacterium]